MNKSDVTLSPAPAARPDRGAGSERLRADDTVRTSVAELEAYAARLRNVQGRMEAALLAGNIATWTIDLINDLVTGDALLAYLFSVDPEAAANGTEPLHTYFNAIHEDDRAYAVKAIEDALERDTPYSVDVRVVLSDGTFRWINSRGTIARDGSGAPTSMFGAVIDITGRLREQESLRISEERLRDAKIRLDIALSAGEIATWTFDIVNNRVVADANLSQMFSVDAAAAAGGELQVYLDAIHPEDRDRVARVIAESIAGGDRFEAEYRVVTADGSARWLVARGQVERDRAGRAVSLPGVVADITRAKSAEAQIEQSQDQYRALFNSMTQGVLYRDAITHVVLSANPAAERILGVTLAQMQGRAIADASWRAMREDGSPMPLEEYPSSQALATGQVIRGNIQGVFNPKLNEIRWVRVDAVPQYLPGETKPYRVYSLFEDITEQRQLQQEKDRLYQESHARAERESLLSDASRVFNESLKYEETLAAVARLIVPRFADWCAVDTIEPDGGVKRVVVEHVDPEKAAWGWELARNYPTRMEDERGIAAVLRTGDPGFTPHLTDAMLTAAIPDQERLRQLLEVGFTSVMIVPLSAREQIFGAISFVATSESGRHFTDDDLQFALEIGQRAALAVENARLFEAVRLAEARQRRIADTLQNSMLLSNAIDEEFDGLSVDSFYEAAWDDALIGGDYGDAFRVDAERVAILVGDCTGKGLEAARFVAECEFMARAFVRENPENPAEALGRINTMLINGQLLDKRPDGALTTLVVAVIHTRTGDVVLAAGGAEPPLVLRAATGTAEEIEVYGPLLGMNGGSHFGSRTLTLAPGDFLLLTTDGMTEARDRKTRKFFGYDGLMHAAEELARRGSTFTGFAREIVARAKQFCGGELSDDICVVAAHFTGNEAAFDI